MLESKQYTKCKVAALVIIVMCILNVSCLAVSNPYTDIKTLVEQSQTRWEETFTSERDETIVVNCPITIPKVELAPVIRVVFYPPLDDAFMREFSVTSKEEKNFTSANSDNTYTYFEKQYDNRLTSKNNPNNFLYPKIYIPLDEIEWDRKYARNSPLTVQEAFDVIEKKAREIYTKYGSSGYYAIELAHGITISGLTDLKGIPVREMDAYEFYGYQLIRGIPVLGNVMSNFGPVGKYKFESLQRCHYYALNVQSEYAYQFAATLFAEEELLYEDIQLVGFDIIKPEIVKLIKNGCIRNVYGVRLGYIAYLEEDHNNGHLRLIPSWIVECDYFNSAKDERIGADLEEVNDYSSGSRFRELVISAQTGKLLNPENKDRDRSEYPKIITWDQVKK